MEKEETWGNQMPTLRLYNFTYIGFQCAKLLREEGERKNQGSAPPKKCRSGQVVQWLQHHSYAKSLWTQFPVRAHTYLRCGFNPVGVCIGGS